MQLPLSPLPTQEMQASNRIRPVTVIQVPPSARSLGQLRRRAWEREARMRNEVMQRNSNVNSGPQILPNIQPPLPTPPSTQCVREGKRLNDSQST